MKGNSVNKWITSGISLLLISALAAVQVFAFLIPCQSFEKEASIPFSPEIIKADYELHQDSMDKIEFDRYLEAAEKVPNGPEAEFLKQRFDMHKQRLKNDFQTWKQDTLVCLTIAVLFELIGVCLLFTSSSSYKAYFLKVGGFLIIAFVGILIWTVCPVLMSIFRLWVSIPIVR